MKRILKSGVAISLAFSMIGAPLAMAQSDQHGPGGGGGGGGGQKSPHSDQVHPSGAQQHTMAHSTVQHSNAAMGKPNNTMPHQMTQPSHEQQRPAPQHEQPQNHHMAPRNMSSGGHQWRHGDHYTGGRNYVTDYNRYHLQAPPSGYQWVQNGSEFLLIAVGSGIIANVILQSFNQ